MVVGWQTAAHMRTGLVTDALQMAIDGGHVAPDAIFHSDRGAQGGSKRSSQHPDEKGCVDGAASRVDDDVDRAPGYALSGTAAGSSRRRAGVLVEDRRGLDQ